MSELQNVAVSLIMEAIPALLGFVVGNLSDTITLIFIGNLNKPELIAAIGLANVFLYTFGTSIFSGLNSSIDILVSQAHRSGNMSLCGQYL